MFSKGLFFAISKILPAKIAYAHCDVPCGIYDPKPAQIAAQTVLKMAQVIQNLSTQNPTVNDKNKFVSSINKMREIGWFSNAVLDKVLMEGEKYGNNTR